MHDEEIRALLQKYATGNLTETEKALLESWYLKQAGGSANPIDEKKMEANLKGMAGRLPVKRKAVLHTIWPRIAAAAAIVLLIIGGWWYADNRTTQKPALAKTQAVQPIIPGKDGAILTLADGHQIVLDTMGNGIIADQSGAQVELQEGRLAYKSLPIAHSPLPIAYLPAFNTLITPRGRQFQLVLPDGTKVWLNAASSIRYPTAFTGKERNVEITGEAYFEVAHNKDKPFHVKSNKQVVEVLGTHFNIMAYDDEPAVKTTLLEGKVKVTAGTAASAILQPGEQATLTRQIKIAPVKTAAAVAWKNGEFMFRNEPLENIMRSVARWYDVDIVYKADVAHKEVWGSITKYGNVSDVLEMIALTGVAHFKVAGRTIIIQS
ncbi:hypothetical protein A4H97_08790 [Niastella yeongjuensis]|uniref:Iron dicitrate transport regulator FecR n=2 Tax=Niastella yeongjuensis TaxID=354355 RepID=A0A1V9EFZ9_9BACT|nr:hypothetical protein A4H97_08790 [Niastella yeongjuensis]